LTPDGFSPIVPPVKRFRQGKKHINKSFKYFVLKAVSKEFAASIFAQEDRRKNDKTENK